MAQWFVSASDANVLDNFTQRNAGGTLSVVDDGGQTAIQMSLPANGRVFYSFDPAGVGQDFEIVARLRTGSAASGRSGAAVGARVSDVSASLNGIRFVDFSLSNGQVGAYVNGVFSQLGMRASLVDSVTDYHWMRARTVGGLIQFKMWDGTPDDEPDAWEMELELTDSTPDGRAGLLVAENGNHFYTHIGFATNGDTAPTEPIPAEGADVELPPASASSAVNNPAISAGASVSVPTAAASANLYSPMVTTAAGVELPTAFADAQSFNIEIAGGAEITLPAASSSSLLYPVEASTGADVLLPAALARSMAYNQHIASGAAVFVDTAYAEADAPDLSVSTGEAQRFVKIVHLAGTYRRSIRL